MARACALLGITEVHAVGGLFEGVPDLRVEGFECMADGFFGYPGVREVHAVEAMRVLADGRAAADADVLGDRLDEFHGAVDVESGTRQDAAERLAGEPGRVAATQVNQSRYGASPVIRSHPPSLRTPQAARRTAHMLDTATYRSVRRSPPVRGGRRPPAARDRPASPR
jgi:hypothetical protein